MLAHDSCRQFNKKNQHRVRLPSGKKIPQIEFHTLLLTIYVKSVLLVHMYALSGCWQRQRAVKTISLFSMSMCLSTKNNQRKFRVVCRAEHGIKQCYIAVGNQRHSRQFCVFFSLFFSSIPLFIGQRSVVTVDTFKSNSADFCAHLKQFEL